MFTSVVRTISSHITSSQFANYQTPGTADGTAKNMTGQTNILKAKF